MDYATTLHGHPAMAHTKIIGNFAVVGHFEYGQVGLFANLQRSYLFFPPQGISRIDSCGAIASAGVIRNCVHASDRIIGMLSVGLVPGL